jgi:hypothetical protein
MPPVGATAGTVPHRALDLFVMYSMNDAHPVTIIIIVGAMMVVPAYLLATYVFSGASKGKSLRIAGAFAVFGAVMSWVCLAGLPRKLGPAGSLFVPAAWILPSLILFVWRDWFLSKELCQKWLVGLQLFRAIGGVFLIEMGRGNIPGIFAYPAGLGDLAVALVAFAVLIRFRREKHIAGWAIFLVIVLGATDFASAFFFGFGSSPSPVQIFFPDPPNQVIFFPTGMIPLFLVPTAIFFHVLSGLTYAKYQRQ